MEYYSAIKKKKILSSATVCPGFWQFDYTVVLCVCIFAFILLRVLWASWMCRLVCFTKPEKFLCTISSTILPASFFLTFSSGVNITCVMVCFIVSQSSLRLCSLSPHSDCFFCLLKSSSETSVFNFSYWTFHFQYFCLVLLYNFYLFIDRFYLFV